MTGLDPADLVVIAARTLGLSTADALAAMDIPAAQAALAEAGRGPKPAVGPLGRTAAAAAGARLVSGLLRHRPFPRQNQQVALAAGLQLLALNGWQADLSPAETAVVVVEALASGRLTDAAAAAWLSPRLRPASGLVRGAQAPAGRATAAVRPGRRRRRLLPAQPGRAAAGALFAGMVGGVAVLAAACSIAPGMATARTNAVRPGSPPAPARAAELAYTACMRAHGLTAFPEPSPTGVVTIAAGAGVDPASSQFRVLAQACRTAVPTAVIHIVTTPARG